MRAFLCNQTFIEEKVFETENETEALLHEQALIRHHGFENLVNTQSHTFTGRRLKPEVGRLISVRLKAYVQRCRSAYGTGHPPEVAAKISAANKGCAILPGHRQKISAAKKGVALTQAHEQALTGIPKRFGPGMKEQRRCGASARLKKAWAEGRRSCAGLNRARQLRAGCQRFYAITSPLGEQFYASGAGIVEFLKRIGLATSVFYRARRSGLSAGWQVVPS